MRLAIRLEDIRAVSSWCEKNIGPITDDRFNKPHVFCQFIRGDKWLIQIIRKFNGDTVYVEFNARNLKHAQKTWFKLNWGWTKWVLNND